MKNANNSIARPFLKWAGGKTQLLPDLEARLPDSIKQTGLIERYVEPFVGGGAFFFYLKSKYKIKKAFLCDNNSDLVLTFKVVKKNPHELIKKLKGIRYRYLKKHQDERAVYYYHIRQRFNNQKRKIDYRQYSKNWIKRAAYLIFLNKTCFNGLYRLNSRGEFNVPFGRYKDPVIFNKDNILAISHALENTKVYCDDFSTSREYVTPRTLVYCDPPYRPLSATSYFTSFTENGFSEEDQKRLAKYCKQVSSVKDVWLILSNSDPT